MTQGELKKVMQMYLDLVNVPSAEIGVQHEEDDEIDFGEVTGGSLAGCAT